MKRHAWMSSLAVAAALATAPAPALAQNCGGFTDVFTTDNYCNAVEWLKNRQITLGCTSTTLYCPSQAVSRGAMALFLNRLGIAVSPKTLTAQDVTPATTIAPNQFQQMCPTATFPAQTYPQIVRARGSISIPATGNLLVLTYYVSQSQAPSFVDMSTTPLQVGPVNGVQNLTWSARGLLIPPNNAVNFVIAVVNPAGSGSNLVLGAGRCAIEVDILNASPTSPPFDE